VVRRFRGPMEKLLASGKVTPSTLKPNIVIHNCKL
jgi:hypothetical protein